MSDDAFFNLHDQCNAAKWGRWKHRDFLTIRTGFEKNKILINPAYGEPQL